MGHNNVVSGHLKFTGISRVDGLSTGPPDLGRHIFTLILIKSICFLMVNGVHHLIILKAFICVWCVSLFFIEAKKTLKNILSLAFFREDDPF